MDPAISTVQDIIPMNNIGRDDLVTTTIDGKNNLDILSPSSEVLPSLEPSTGIDVVSTVPNEKLMSTAVTNKIKKVTGITKTVQDLTNENEKVTIKEPLSSSVNKARGTSDKKLEGNQNPSQKEHPKPMCKKSVRLLLRNPM